MSNTSNSNTTSAETAKKKKKGMPVGVRKTIAYIVLILITILCLFWFYVLFINATRTNSQITHGFSAVPGASFLNNWNNLIHGTLPVLRGMLNSFIIAGCSAFLCVYFSAMTAYGLYAYEFKMKKFLNTMILGIMMIPTQVTALGFVQLVQDMRLEDNFIPLIIPSISVPVTYFYMRQYMQSSLPMDPPPPVTNTV